MGINQEVKWRCNGNVAKRFVGIVWSCWLLTFVLTTDLYAARTYTITATAGGGGSVSPSGAVKVNSGANQTFTVTSNAGYHVSDVAVDGVSQGAITSYTFSNITVNHTIAATFGINSYTIAATAWSGGTISPTTATVNYGGSQTFTIAPSAGFYIADVTVDGVSHGAITSYSFTNVSASHTIAATFANNTYAITVTSGNGGTVSPVTSTVTHGGTKTFTITPDTGYNIAFVMMDGVSQGAISSYTFSNVAADHTISAIFTTNTSPTPSSSANYFYDNLGRLIRTIAGTTVAIYQYDELGNMKSTTNDTTTGGPPSLSAVSPNVLFIGNKVLVAITGQSLLATDSFNVNQGLVTIDNVNIISDSFITAEMTALSPGTETFTVTTRNGTASISAMLSASHFALSPGQLPIIPGGSGTITATITPPIAIPFTINLANDAPSIATVPQSVTVPVSGSASFIVKAVQEGAATIDAHGTRAVVLVSPPFSGDVDNLTTSPVSVSIDTPSGGNTSTTAGPVSVSVDAPTAAPSTTTASSVSVYVDAPAAAPSTTTAGPVSVNVTAPTGDSPTVSAGVSVKIQ